MAQVPLAPPPQSGGPIDGWLFLLWKRLTATGQLLWSGLSFTGSNLTDLETRNHNDLQNLDAGDYKHFTAANYTDLTDAGDSTLHYHATDRARANHTGTQAASTISDFDTEVSNNTDVAANTAARHAAVTVSDTTSIDFTLTGQQISAVVLPAGVSHSSLADLNSTSYTHLTAANATDLTDGGDSTLHYHATDRARANHSGTQTASTISDFDTEVSNNTDVAANTSARHAAVTVSDTSSIDFTLTGQQISAAVIPGGVSHSGLADLNSTNYYHLTQANHTDLTDGGDSTLHYHAADRNADNHSSGSTNKVFTATEQTKLAGIETGAEVNNISDVNATDLTDGGETSLHTHAFSAPSNAVSGSLTVASETSYIVIDHLTVSGTLTVNGLVAII